MPKITKLASFDFTLENFLDACSPAELKEVDILIQSNKYRNKMKSKKVIEIERDDEERREIEALGFSPEFYLGPKKNN